MLTRYGAPARQLQLEALRRAIAHHRAETQRRLLGKPGVIAHSRGLLREARGQVRELTIDAHDWNVLGEGLQRVYSRCRRAMTNVEGSEGSDSTAAFHEWRKQVKGRCSRRRALTPWPRQKPSAPSGADRRAEMATKETQDIEPDITQFAPAKRNPLWGVRASVVIRTPCSLVSRTRIRSLERAAKICELHHPQATGTMTPDCIR